MKYLLILGLLYGCSSSLVDAEREVTEDTRDPATPENPNGHPWEYMVLNTTRDIAVSFYGPIFDKCIAEKVNIYYLDKEEFNISFGGYRCKDNDNCGVNSVIGYWNGRNIVLRSGYKDSKQLMPLLVHEAGHWLYDCGENMNPPQGDDHLDAIMFGPDSPAYEGKKSVFVATYTELYGLTQPWGCRDCGSNEDNSN